MTKLRSIADLAIVTDDERIVLSHGCFDCLHIGHIRHLQQAKAMGSILIVTVTPDRFVNKGKGRPVFNESVRVEMIAALECVDYVAINEWPTAVEAIREIMPTIFVKGAEYRDRPTLMLEDERRAVEFVGGELVFTDGDECHTTDILRMYAGS